MAAGTFRIGYEPEFPPLTFADGSRGRGLIIDLLSDVLGRIGRQPEFVPTPLPAHQEAIESGAVEGIAFKAIVPERTETYDFSSPLMTTGAAWFSTMEHRWPEGDSPATGRIATPASGPLIQMLGRKFPGLEIVEVGTYPDALSAAATGDVDAAALNFHIATRLARQRHPGVFVLPSAPFLQQPIGFAVAKGRTDTLLRDFDEALAEALAEGVRTRLESDWLTGA